MTNREIKKESILKEFEKFGGQYPSDVANKLELDLREMVELTNELVSEGKLVECENGIAFEPTQPKDTIYDKLSYDLCILSLKISRIFALPYLKYVNHDLDNVGVFMRALNRDMMIDKHGFSGCATIIEFGDYLGSVDEDGKTTTEE